MPEITNIEYWTTDIVRWPPNALDGLSLDANDRYFLQHVGLPQDPSWTLRFATPTTPARRPEGVSDLLVIGWDASTPLCIHEPGGQILAVEESAARVRFLNTSIVQFAHFLVIYHRYRVLVRDMEDAEAERLIDTTASSMRRADGAALADEETYWSVVLEQMRDGLL